MLTIWWHRRRPSRKKGHQPATPNYQITQSFLCTKTAKVPEIYTLKTMGKYKAHWIIFPVRCQASHRLSHFTANSSGFLTFSIMKIKQLSPSTSHQRNFLLLFVISNWLGLPSEWYTRSGHPDYPYILHRYFWRLAFRLALWSVNRINLI